MRSKRFENAFQRLAAAEAQFLESEFLAPSLSQAPIRLRIAGVVCRMEVASPGYSGWGVFRPESYTTARFIRPATLAERRHYLQLFPLVRLILCRREKSQWTAVPAHRGDSRFRIEGAVPLHFVEETEQFETVRARFDGSQFWFEEIDPSANPAAPRYLRDALRRSLAPEELAFSGLTPEQSAAYAANYWLSEASRARREAEANDRRIRDALRHAGAELIDYLERGDSFRVTYSVAGRRHVSAVDKRSLSVQVAGICLSGQDRQFDLASLVGVLREAEQGGEIVRVGDDDEGLQENQYWDIHPPAPDA